MKYFNLNRFVEAQDRFNDYETAKQELTDGEKRSHWIWYIFPQIKGLGHSGMAQAYSIESLFEACAYLQHPVLGQRLYEISKVLYDCNYGRDIEYVMRSSIDAIKLKSSMTLFELVAPDSVFSQVLDHFYHGDRDRKTLQILGDEPSWLLGKDAYFRNGVKKPTPRAFLEGIDSEDFEPNQLLATNIDLIMRGHTMVNLCMNHLVNHNDIFGEHRPHDIHICLVSYMYSLLDDFLHRTKEELLDCEVKFFARCYERLDEDEFDDCLDAAGLFDEIVKMLLNSSTLQGPFLNFVKDNTLLKLE